MERIKLGISTCLLGENVRYDGGHQRDPFLTDTLGVFVDYVPVCPEVECGLGVPREAMHLTGDPASPRLVTRASDKDLTDRMNRWAHKRVKSLEKEGLCGFIFKARSPSSGMERVKVYDEKGMPSNKGTGLFARAFMDHFPLIPVEEDGRLHDPGIRENFIERIFALRRWRDLVRGKSSLGGLVAFHAREKLLIYAHSERHLRRMGKIVAMGKGRAIKALFREYETLFLEALKLKTTVKKHINVLQHMMGYFKKDLEADEKQELLELMDQYRQGHLPLIVLTTLMGHYVRKFKEPYLSRQTYLNPHPLELRLRNHV